MNKIDLQGRAAVVTGGAQGVGLAITRRLAESGAKVTVWDVNTDGLRDILKSECVDAHSVDVSDEDAVRRAAEEVGPVSILVNNAGVGGPYGPLCEASKQEFEHVFSVNVTGAFLCCRSIVPGMVSAGYGRIVNIASVAGKEGNANTAPYSATKAALISLTKSLGKELALSGVTVNCVTPAAIKTNILSNRDPEHIKIVVDKIPMKRFGTAEEVASMVAWLSSEEASFSTGAVFDVSGGRAVY